MGAGDDIMATGMAKGAAARSKRIAFGDGRRIIWGPFSAEMFRNNINIAPPGCEHAPDIEWIAYYKGNRLYNKHIGDRWVWNMEFHAQPGEIYFDEREQRLACSLSGDYVIIEPNVPNQKSCAPNKQWPADRYQQVAELVRRLGFTVVQFRYKTARYILDEAAFADTSCLRDALAIMSNARCYIGPEGGLHHGAAAVGIPAVVLFGGWIPPAVTGYADHINLAIGEPCGSLKPCAHCRQAMDKISVDEVMDGFERLLA